MPSKTSNDRLNRLLDREKKTAPKKKTRRRRTKKTTVDLTRLEEMNESELVSLAHLIGFERASRQMLKEDLISLILGEIPEAPEDPVAPVRDRIWDYVQGNRRLMPSTMPCDLHCPTCPHRMVVECFVTNQDHLE